jgi:hypothetical protein
MIRNSFISPELAYSNEKKKFFDKIGYNKHPNLLHKTSNNSDVKPSVAISLSNPGSTLRFINPTSKDETLFMRKRAKADDSFYEKRV